MSVSDTYLAVAVNAAAVAKHHGVKAFIDMSQMTLAQMSITTTTTSPHRVLGALLIPRFRHDRGMRKLQIKPLSIVAQADLKKRSAMRRRSKRLLDLYNRSSFVTLGKWIHCSLLNLSRSR